MELRHIKVYDFEELNEDAQEKVLNALKEQNDYYFLEESLTESLNEELEKNALKSDNTKLRYSLGCSQGDGLSFIGLVEYRGVLFNIELGNLSNHYSHKYTTDINAEEDDDDSGDITEEINQVIEEEFKKLYYSICDRLEKQGYSIIEAEDSEENIKENIKANDYKFNKSGEII